MESQVEFIGLTTLKDAIERNPKVVLSEGRQFLTRGLAVYKSGIINSPWRIGGSGGGSPVSNDSSYTRKYQKQRSGNLRDTHQTEISGLQGVIGPSFSAASYAKFVHGGTRKMQARPWLDFVKKNSDGKITELYQKMLQNIASDLAQ